jgi:tRNA(adenine34) deaminase
VTASSSPDLDAEFMRCALDEARDAGAAGEVPVGACLVVDGREIARGYNQTLADGDPTAHAEVVVLRRAAKHLGNHRTGGTVYVTREPCLMCMGALVQARVERLVFAARDPKAGAAVSLYRIGEDQRLNHRVEVAEGLLGEQASRLLTDFFRARRT